MSLLFPVIAPRNKYSRRNIKLQRIDQISGIPVLLWNDIISLQ
jgi:hypothetical protein